MIGVDNRDLGRYVRTTVEGKAGLIEETGDFVSRALQHLHDASASGLEEGGTAEFVADPNIQTASSGTVAVHAQQFHQGIPVFQADNTVLFGPDGALQQSIGSTVEVGKSSQSTSIIDPPTAIGAAIDFLNQPENRAAEPDQFGQVLEPGKALARVPQEVIAAFPDQPSRPTVVDPGPFEGRGIGCHLVWVPLGGQLRLGWTMELHRPDSGSVLVIVDALDSSIIFASETTQGILGRASVFAQRGDQSRTVQSLPLPITGYPVQSATQLPAQFPDDWLSGSHTAGNSVAAVDAQNQAPVAGSLAGSVVEFSSPDPDSAEQRVVNLFYYCNLLHDLYYLLGFRERDGNFQVDSLGRGGVSSDAVLATVYPGAVSATANMTTPKDGSQPRLNVGVLTSTGRHTALDASVIFHEFSHGLTSRLIGGPLNAVSLLAPQSAGMSEGWSDYFACSIIGINVIAAWVANKAEGIRRHPYDANYPGSFNDLGKPDFSNKHQIGELWCATLLEFDRQVGSPLALQVVVDSLKLMPANPSFLDARDAMVRALDSMAAANMVAAAAHRSAINALWTAFGHFGMGPAATTDGAQLDGIVADTTVPGASRGPTTGSGVQTRSATPRLTIPDKDPVGVTSALPFDVAGTVASVKVGVDIQHEYRGDLQVTLISPSGTRVVLHATDPEPGIDLVAAYDATSTPALAGLAGEPIRGTWQLHVADLSRLSVGVFRTWTLTLGVG